MKKYTKKWNQLLVGDPIYVIWYNDDKTVVEIDAVKLDAITLLSNFSILSFYGNLSMEDYYCSTSFVVPDPLWNTDKTVEFENGKFFTNIDDAITELNRYDEFFLIPLNERYDECYGKALEIKRNQCIE